MSTHQIPIDAIDPVPEPKTRRKRNGDGRAVAKVEAASTPAPVSQEAAFLALFERLARDPQVDPARIQQFLEMRRAEEDRQAVRAFNAAMAAAKAEFDPIIKRHLVDYVNKTGGRTTYKHEDLADIENAVKPALSAHGLNYRFRGSSNPNDPVAVTCILSHSAGHFEETTLTAGADNSGGKNSIQAVGSSIRYLQRYTLTLALGLAAGRNDDGKAAGDGGFITEEIADSIRSELDELGADIPKFCEALGVEAITKIPTRKVEAAKVIINMKRKLAGKK